MHQHDLFQKMNDLHQQTQVQWTNVMAQEFEKIDKTIGRLMDDAESKCRKLRTGAVPWSPTYKKYALHLYIGLCGRHILMGYTIMSGN